MSTGADDPLLLWWWDEPPVTCERCGDQVDWMELNEGGQRIECGCGATIWES